MRQFSITLTDEPDGKIRITGQATASRLYGGDFELSPAHQLGERLMDYLESIEKPEEPDPNGTADFEDIRDDRD